MSKASLAVLVVWCIILIATLLVQGLTNSVKVANTFYVILALGGCVVYPIVVLCCKKSGESRNPSITILNDSDAHDIDVDNVGENVDRVDFMISMDDASMESNEENPIVIGTENDIYDNHRIHFLDNVKIFLTFIVVSHHVGCAFGGAGVDSWFLVIGNYDSSFNRLLSYFLELNQGYFMPLFFFISAYFTPSSYEKKGKWNFHNDKARRLALPLITVVLFICPVTIMIASAISRHPIFYFPVAGHAWFILWLIFLNVIYSTIYEADNLLKSSNQSMQQLSDEPRVDIPSPLAEQRKLSLPGTCQRMLAGTMICGCLMVAVIILLKGKSFMGMPIAIGSIICDLLFFYLGICSKRHGWLEKSLGEQLDIPIWLLRLTVALEAGFLYAFKLETLGRLGLLYIPTVGLFCLDMSLVVLELFQSNADFSTPLTRYFSETAYTVYLIHPIVVTGCTAAFIAIYRALCVESEIDFDGGYFFTASSSKFVGPDNGGGVLALGFVCVNIISNLLLWPIAWQLRRLPALKNIL